LASINCIVDGQKKSGQQKKILVFSYHEGNAGKGRMPNRRERKMDGRYRKLFEPVKIGKVEIKNRVVMAPMGIVGLVNPDGSLSARAIEYYIERARGGVGLIITAVHKVENDGDFGWRSPGFPGFSGPLY
jgi:hypothetical protein